MIVWIEAGLGVALLTLGILLFKMHDSKYDEMAKDSDRTYAHVRKNRLDPMMQQILASPMGRHRPAEFFQMPEVLEKLDAYKQHLFEFMDADHGKDEASVSLGLLWRVCLGTGITTIVVAGLYELTVSVLEAPMIATYVEIANVTILIFALIISVHLANLYTSQNRRFKVKMRQLRGGQA